MGLFEDPVHDDFGSWTLGFAPYAGGDYGEVRQLASQVTPGDDASFAAAFRALAERRIQEADTLAARGRTASARDCYLRAAGLLAVGLHPLYGTPPDPRLVDAFHLAMDAFGKGLALWPAPAVPVQVPYEDTTLPAYFVRAPGYENAVRPTILVGGGWDSTMIENYFGLGAAALARGYHVLLHDGPGQGRLLIEENRPLRYDWEAVITPVVDAALAIDGVDPDRIVYEPWSLGGYMAPRVAAFEHRLAAIVCDPGQLDVGGKFGGIMKLAGLSDEAIAGLPELGADDEAKVMALIDGNRPLRWKIVQRGFWTNGAPSLSAFLAEMSKWKLDPATIAEIRCPTLVCWAESDPASSNAQDLYDALTCEKELLRFYDADGSGDHCEILNRSLANRRILDWLDQTLSVTR